MLAVQLKRTVNINNDVANNQPSCKQDCRDVVNISVFFDGTGNNEDADKKEKNGPILPVYGVMLEHIVIKTKQKMIMQYMSLVLEPDLMLS